MLKAVAVSWTWLGRVYSLFFFSEELVVTEMVVELLLEKKRELFGESLLFQNMRMIVASGFLVVLSYRVSSLWGIFFKVLGGVKCNGVSVLKQCEFQSWEILGCLVCFLIKSLPLENVVFKGDNLS